MCLFVAGLFCSTYVCEIQACRGYSRAHSSISLYGIPSRKQAAMHLFIQPVVHGHLGLFWFKTMLKSDSMNILVHDFWRIYVYISCGQIHIPKKKFWIIQEGLFSQKSCFVPLFPPCHLLQVMVVMGVQAWMGPLRTQTWLVFF